MTASREPLCQQNSKKGDDVDDDDDDDCRLVERSVCPLYKSCSQRSIVVKETQHSRNITKGKKEELNEDRNSKNKIKIWRGRGFSGNDGTIQFSTRLKTDAF